MLKVEKRKIEELIPYINNARTHTDEQVNQIAASIKEFGWTNPILIADDNVIAGHGRIRAAQKLNMKEIPAIDISHLTESQRKAYIIADNKLALNAGWDDDLLKLELETFSDDELALTGFSPEELNIIFHGWQSDLDVKEKHGENLDGIGGKILIKVSPDAEQFAREVITNALDEAGIDYEQ